MNIVTAMSIMGIATGFGHDLGQKSSIAAIAHYVRATSLKLLEASPALRRSAARVYKAAAQPASAHS